MKIHLLTVPLLVLLLASRTLGNTCATLNPFIKTLNPDLLLRNPSSATSPKCHFLWQKGTCCNPEKLQEATKSYNNRMQSSIDSYVESLQLFVTNLAKVRDNYKLQSKTGGTLVANIFQQNQNLYLLSQALSENFVATQLQNVNRCWMHLRKARAAALCNTCAADSRKYFRGNKAIITKGDCAAMIAECQGYFFFIIKMIQSIQYIAGRMSGFSHRGGDMQEMVRALNQVMPKVTGNTLIQLIESHQNRLICESLYNLNAPSFIERVNPFFQAYALKIDNIIAGVVEFCRPGRECSLPEPRKLKLNARPASELQAGSGQLFASDVVVFQKQDNMFKSHVGAHGSDSHLDEAAQPMNLTLVDLL